MGLGFPCYSFVVAYVLNILSSVTFVAVSFAPSHTHLFSCISLNFNFTCPVLPLYLPRAIHAVVANLAGNLAGGTRFNIRPRTRPRWFRESDNGSAGDGGGKGSDLRDPHPDRDRRGGIQRSGGGMEMGRGFREARGGAGSGPGCSGRGGRGRGRGEFARAPSFRVTVPDDNGRHLVLRRQYKKSDARSRYRSRSRTRARSGSSPCSGSSDNGSASREGSLVRCEALALALHFLVLTTFIVMCPEVFSSDGRPTLC